MSDIVLKGDDGSTIVLNAPAETLIVLDGGLRGETGAAGATGPTGATGQGVPTGGTTNQYLKKNSATNYDTSWDSLDKTDVGLGNVPNTDFTAAVAANTAKNSYPSEDAAKLAAITGTNTGDETAATIKTKLGITTLSGSNTGDQDLSGYATTDSVALKADITYVDSQDAELTTAISGKEPTITAGTTAQYYRGDKTFQTLDKTAVGLSNVDNTSDVDKPVSTAQQTALDGKLNLAGGTMTGALVVSPTNTASIAISGNNAAGSTAKLMSLSLGGAEAFDVSSSGQLNVRNITPRSSLSHNLGAASTYWNNLYSQTLNLNSTASISGSVAGVLGITGILGANFIKSSTGNPYWWLINTNDSTTYGGMMQSTYYGMHITHTNSTNIDAGTNRLYIGRYGSFTNPVAIGTSDNIAFNSIANFRNILDDGTGKMVLANSSGGTHTLTLGSTGTGIALYNTSDQTTNYERGLIRWSANVLRIESGQGGTGTPRSIVVSTQNGRAFTVNDSIGSDGAFNFKTTTSAGASVIVVNPTLNASSGVQYGLSISTTYNQTLTAGGIDFLINRTQAAVGTGVQRFADFQVGGVSRASIDNTGAIMVTGFDAALSTKTANYTLIVSDYTILFDATAGNLVATLPTAASSTGRVYNIKKMDSTANTVTIDANASETIDGALTKVISTQFNSYTIQSTGTGWVVI